jgi:ATP-dependent helicase/nuclease subunit B
LSKQIWLAPILSNNRQRLLERASEILASGPSEGLLYLAASRPLLELAAVRLLDGVRNRGVWGSLPVHLFRGFSRYVLATALEEETQSPLTRLIAIDQKELPLKRSLIAQIISRLAREERLKAITPLAHREGCINTITTLIGEIQRAGKTPSEFSAIVAARESDAHPPVRESSDGGERKSVPLQVDFDKDIASIYESYASALEEFGFTEADADQLRALEALRGEISGKKVVLPWLSSVRLLIVDGFFDFTPVQGDILRLLIPQIPEVIVNLSRDERNTEIFRPFDRTIEQLSSMAKFEVIQSSDANAVAAGLSSLRKRLFNTNSLHVEPTVDDPSCEKPDQELAQTASIRVLDCGDRETELRAIAKEIKRLILLEGYRLSEVAVVLRQQGPYKDEITRVFSEEQISCTLNSRIELTEVPAVRAAVKLFDLLIALGGDTGALKANKIADLAKSGYFGLSEDELAGLRARFELQDLKLVDIPGYRREPAELKVGFWDVDELENAVAFVGDDLRVPMWIIRARKLTAHPAEPEPPEEKVRDPEPDAEPEPDEEASVTSEQSFAVRKATAGQVFEPVDIPLPGSERRAKPARELHPALIAWSALLIDRFASILNAAPKEGSPREMRDCVIRLLDRLQFAREVRGSERTGISERALSGLTLDLRGLEGLRRALFAATRSLEINSRPTADCEQRPVIRLASLLEEILGCINSQTLLLSSGDPDGLRVLEATDIRGLQFRAVFIAGLNEGAFPLRALRDWIYPHEERERLKDYGLTLEDISPETLLKEEHYFYQAACRATERLYLSRPLVKEDGSETVASYYIEEIARAIAPTQLIRDTIRRDFDGSSLFESSRPGELALLVVRQEERRSHYAQRNGNFAPDVIARLVGNLSALSFVSDSARQRIAIERERGGLLFGDFDGRVNESALVEKLKNQYGLRPFSASELSLYGKCPFKFFAEKVLKLEPRGEAALDMTALDAGSLLHDALRRFFELHRNQRLADLDPDELKRELREAADAVFEQHERTVPPLNPKVWDIDREIKKLLLEQVLDYELTIEQQTKKEDVRPSFFELAFGMQNQAIDPSSIQQPLELQRAARDQSETIRIRGQIDRVDRAKDGTVIAYDYKLSRGATIDDMAEGRALQLHIYLAALEQLVFKESKIAGAGYYTIKGTNNRRNQGLYRKAMNAYTGITNAKSNMEDSDWMSVRGEMQDRIWEFIDGIREGRFLVAPSAPDDSCPRCDYSAVCRYEKFRIRRKVEDDRRRTTGSDEMTRDRRTATENKD